MMDSTYSSLGVADAICQFSWYALHWRDGQAQTYHPFPGFLLASHHGIAAPWRWMSLALKFIMIFHRPSPNSIKGPGQINGGREQVGILFLTFLLQIPCSKHHVNGPRLLQKPHWFCGRSPWSKCDIRLLRRILVNILPVMERKDIPQWLSHAWWFPLELYRCMMEISLHSCRIDSFFHIYWRNWWNFSFRAVSSPCRPQLELSLSQGICCRRAVVSFFGYLVRLMGHPVFYWLEPGTHNLWLHYWWMKNDSGHCWSVQFTFPVSPVCQWSVGFHLHSGHGMILMGWGHRLLSMLH